MPRNSGNDLSADPRAAPVRRWECHCQEPPFLLGTYDQHGINIKMRDRYWHVQGTTHAVCPRCGSIHVLTRPTPAVAPISS